MRELRYISLFFLLYTLVISCDQSREKAVSESLIIPKSDKNLFTTSYFLDQNFEELSFPNWFNKELINSKKIKNIQILEVNPNRIIDGMDSLLLNDSYSFSFSETGWVSAFTHIDYHDAILLTEEHFNYNHPPDSLGFSIPIVKWSKKNKKYETIHGLVGVLEVLSKYNKYAKTYEDSSFIIFQNELHPNRELEVYILDSTKWNVVAVDQIIKDHGLDYIHYGTPLKPIQSYRLENMVEKTDWTIFNYINNTNFLEQVTIQNKFTLMENNVFYDSLGRLDAFESLTRALDSTVIELQQNKVQYDDNNLPVKIIYSTGHDTASLAPKSKKIISYTFEED